MAKTMRTERVSFVDLAANPRLAARARAELDPLVFASPGAVDMNGHAQVCSLVMSMPDGRAGWIKQSADIPSIFALVAPDDWL